MDTAADDANDGWTELDGWEREGLVAVVDDGEQVFADV